MTEGKQTRATTEKRSSWKTGNVSSVIIDQAPLQETEYQKAVREYNERMENEGKKTASELNKAKAKQEQQAEVKIPQVEAHEFTMQDAARMIMKATAGLDPKARGIFIEMMVNMK